MKKTIFIFLMILLSGINFASANGGRVDILLDYPRQVELNKDFQIKFEVFNNSNDRLWDATVAIEKEFMEKYGKYIKTSRNYSSNPFKYVVIGPGYKMDDVFTLNLSENFPEEEVKFNIVVEGKKGACRCDGTTVYLKQEVLIKTFFKKTQADLILEKKYFEVYSGDILEIPVIINNTGDILIRNIIIDIKGEGLADNSSEISYIQPGKNSSEKISALIDRGLSGNVINGKISIIYKDQNGKTSTSNEVITIKIIEKPINAKEEITNLINVEENKGNNRFNMKYLILIIPLASIILIIFFYIVIIKQ